MDPELKNFLDVFEDRVRTEALSADDHGGDVGLDPREISFASGFLETLEDAGQVSDLEPAYLEKMFGRAKAKANAYGISEPDA